MTLPIEVRTDNSLPTNAEAGWANGNYESFAMHI